jgi:small nuclear ribonucleoprotein B and B'
MLRYINYRMKVTLQDSRVLVGTFLAFDRHMNIVLGDTEEYRKIKSKVATGREDKEEKRVIGLIILRGDSVISLTIEGPPPAELSEKTATAGPGVVKAVGRGLPVAPASSSLSGLTGPARGLVGGPGVSMMQPQIIGQPMGMGPPGMAPGMPPRGFPMPPPNMMGMPPRGMPGMPPGMGMGFPPGPPGMGMGMGFPPRGMPPGMMPPPRGPPGGSE